MTRRRSRTALALALVTAALIGVGAALYVYGLIGWAQAGWVFASGTAGATVTIALEARA